MMRFLSRLRAFVFSLLHIRTLGTRVLAIDDNNNVVLIRETYGTNTWKMPGGGMRGGESAQDAALREAREEVGLQLQPGTSDVTLLGFYFRMQGNWTDHMAVYVVRNWTIDFKANREIAACQLFPIDDLPTDISPATRRRISEWRGESPVSNHW